MAFGIANDYTAVPRAIRNALRGLWMAFWLRRLARIQQNALRELVETPKALTNFSPGLATTLGVKQGTIINAESVG
jgi:ABC-type sulfate transport system permease component